MSEPDPSRIWRYKANYFQKLESKEFSIEVQTGDWQLRDEDPVGTADVRILAVGDSFTFGWGVQEEDRYSEMLEKLLTERLPGKTVKVLNAGHWMSTFDQHLLVIKELVPRFEPHLVLHGVYGGHVITIGGHSWVTDSRGGIRQVKFVGFQNEVVVREDGALQRTNRLIESPPFKSRFLAKVFQRYYRWKQLRDTQISAVALLDPNDDSLDDAWRKAEEAIRQSATFLSERSIPYVVFHIPADMEVSDDEWREGDQRASESLEVDPDLVERNFAEIVTGTAATWAPLLGAFRDSYDPSLYFPRDPHWTPAGHELAAINLLPSVLEALRDDR